MRTLLHSIIDFFLPKRCIGCQQVRSAVHYGFCADCAERIIPAGPGGNGAHHLARYEGPVATAIRTFKYSRVRWISLPFARWMHQYLVSHPEIEFDCIIPVPLHWRKEFVRTFNQSHLIAANLSRLLNVQLMSRVLIRTRNTRSQTGLDHRARAENVKGAFTVADQKRVKGRSVLLIDDVLTTGATALEAKRALRRAGAKSVTIITIAKA